MKLLDMEVNEIRSAVIVNPVNCVGVMGKGLAKVMKSIYPWAFDDYVKKCKSNVLRPGEIVVSTHPQTLIEFEQPPPVIIHAATKDHWRNKTKIEWINSVLKQLDEFMTNSPLNTIAIPKLGCGLGGLSWDLQVKQLFKQRFSNVDYDVIVFDKPTEEE